MKHLPAPHASTTCQRHKPALSCHRQTTTNTIGLLKNTPGESAALPASLQAAAVDNNHRNLFSAENCLKLTSSGYPNLKGRILSQWPL